MATTTVSIASPTSSQQRSLLGQQELSSLGIEGSSSSSSSRVRFLGSSNSALLKCEREYFQVSSSSGSSSGNWPRVGRRASSIWSAVSARGSNAGIGLPSSTEELSKKKSFKGLESSSSVPIQFESGEEPPTVVSAPNRRIVAIGDLHGDFERTQWALQLAGVLSKDGLHRWVGGTTVLVQVGDVLDRGEDEIAILSLLAWLGKQARNKGGAVFQVLGNHETMNVAGDFRYVAPGGFQEAEAFAEYCEEEHGGDWDAAFEVWHEASQELKSGHRMDLTGWLPMFNPLRMHKGVATRMMLFSPGGPVAKQLACHGVALKVNDWLFAHGGVLPHHVDYGLDRMNREVSMWMKMANNRWGQPSQMPFIAVKGFDSIVWSRMYSKENFEKPEEKIQACAILSAALTATNSRGLVVGHTPQTIGANCKCDGKIWRIDVGMSSGVLHALPEVLEIMGNEVRILRMAEEFLQEDEDPAEEWSGSMRMQNMKL